LRGPYNKPLSRVHAVKLIVFLHKENGERVVRAVGVEPTRALQPCGFSYRLRLSPP
jgi:hypothetical protein